ncbi:TetR/AcrR family transcriptional regulator [Ruthenibacterium lactatiformans]|uniref:TetR/AcrR family transcriptional regulator n=1 Tax=Ruthenibacterium lactatiformans TaxID=1550024 RepID=UPI003522D5C0
MARNKYPEETVARILDVSLKLFLEKGYENTTIQDIIDALGNLSKGAIYHHFKSKEDILEAVCDQRLFAGVEALMNEVVTDKRLNGREKLTRMFTASLQNTEQGKFFSAAPDMTHTPRLMMLQLDSQIREVGPNYLEPVLREGNADGSLHVEHVREASDLLLLITNQYLNPLLYPMTPEEARGAL